MSPLHWIIAINSRNDDLFNQDERREREAQETSLHPPDSKLENLRKTVGKAVSERGRGDWGAEKEPYMGMRWERDLGRDETRTITHTNY